MVAGSLYLMGRSREYTKKKRVFIMGIACSILCLDGELCIEELVVLIVIREVVGFANGIAVVILVMAVFPALYAFLTV